MESLSACCHAPESDAKYTHQNGNCSACGDMASFYLPEGGGGTRMTTYCNIHEEDMTSKCCGARAIDETDFCRQCRDHAEFECIINDWMCPCGKLIYISDAAIGLKESIICPACKGEFTLSEGVCPRMCGFTKVEGTHKWHGGPCTWHDGTCDGAELDGSLFCQCGVPVGTTNDF